MKRYLLSLVFLLAAFTARADQYQSQTISNSGGIITITNGPAATSGTFNYSIVGGAPATLTIVLQGCSASTCTTLDTYTTVANANRTPTIGTAYATFAVQASWTGCSSCSVVIGSTLFTPAPAADGVTSFNTRTGAISPASGDYTAAQVTNAVASSTTVNGHALSGNVTVTNSDLGAVPTSTTVNGHALSAAVTVSASDLTTGTLPHGQLPTLLSGDIPANAANTSGSRRQRAELHGGKRYLRFFSGFQHCDLYDRAVLNFE
jgi:hypothetical protein